MNDQVLTAERPEQTAAPTLTLRFELSPTIGTLFGALAKAQKAFKPVKKTSKNPFYKSSYADLAEVIEATRDALSDNGLAIVQPPCYRRADGTVEVHTFMGHSSGEWMHSILDMPPTAKTDAQAVGSSITYGRRYAYSGTVCVASEDDDDGNAAVSKDFKRKEEPVEDFDQRTEGQRLITSDQVVKISNAIKETCKTEEMVKAALGYIHVDRIESILRQDFDKFLKWANGPTNTKATAKEKAVNAVKAVGGTAVAASVLSPPETGKVMKRLFATANEFHIPETDVKRFAYEKFGVDSMTKLSVAQLEETIQFVKDVAENAQ